MPALQDTPFVHLLSGLDEDDQDPKPSLADACAISGYNAWMNSTTPTITIGWDRRLEVSQAGPRYIRTDLPRSNVMLLDTAQCDHGPSRTGILLKIVVDTLQWPDATA